MDDGLLLNFEVGESTTGNVISSTKYKGRWKERALSKKWDRIKARRPFNETTTWKRPENPVQQTSNGDSANKESKVIETNTVLPSRPLKRKRKDTLASSSNATPVIPRNFTSSSLFTGNPEITEPQPKQPVDKEPIEPKEIPTPPSSTLTSSSFES